MERGNFSCGTRKGQQGLTRRAGETPRRPEQHQDRVKQRYGMRPENAERQKQPAANRLQHGCQAIDPALVEAVGDVARRQREQEHRQELAQSHQAKRQRRAFHVVDLPADRNRLNLYRHRGDEPRTDEEIEIAGAIKGGRDFAHDRKI
jgi:hypothetical protein